MEINDILLLLNEIWTGDVNFLINRNLTIIILNSKSFGIMMRAYSISNRWIPKDSSNISILDCTSSGGWSIVQFNYCVVLVISVQTIKWRLNKMIFKECSSNHLILCIQKLIQIKTLLLGQNCIPNSSLSIVYWYWIYNGKVLYLWFDFCSSF